MNSKTDAAVTYLLTAEDMTDRAVHDALGLLRIDWESVEASDVVHALKIAYALGYKDGRSVDGAREEPLETESEETPALHVVAVPHLAPVDEAEGEFDQAEVKLASTNAEKLLDLSELYAVGPSAILNIIVSDAWDAKVGDTRAASED